jgi:hypothetical protein
MMPKESLNDTQKTTLSDKQAKALGRVLQDVSDLESGSKPEANAKVDDAPEAKSQELNSEAVAATSTPETTKQETSGVSDILALSQEYAKVSGLLASANAENQALREQLATSEAKFVKAQGDTDLLAQAASHACTIYSIQLGKPASDFDQLPVASLANKFVGLRKEFLDTYPETQNSSTPDDTSNSVKPQATVHPISTANSSR